MRALRVVIASALLALAAAIALFASLGLAGTVKHAAVVPPPCSAQPPQQVTNHWPATRTQLAPKRAHAIRLCRYSKFQPGSGNRLAATRLVTKRATTTKLVTDFDQLRALVGVYSCPVDDGAQILARLAYDHHRATITVGLGGCGLVANGHLTRTTLNVGNQNPAGPRLLAELKRLVG